MSRISHLFIGFAFLAAFTITLAVSPVHARQSRSEFCQKFVGPSAFSCSEHKIHSEDGFELVMHRIRSSEKTDSRPDGSGNAPVLLMHTEFLSGDSWLQFTNSSDRLLPLLLASADFDVWVGHERATYWSHGHLKFQSNNRSFWNWTWDDHAHYDVPCYLEYINFTTGSAVHYIGVSQSATAGAATATMAQSSPFIRSLTLLGPTIYRGGTRSSIVMAAWAFLFGNMIDEANYENGYQGGAFNFSTAFPGVTSISGQSPVARALGLISGPNCCLGTASVNFTNGWDGTNSFKNLLHYQQGIRNNTWARFDYGSTENNTQAYGVAFAPTYEPEDIPTDIPILVVYGGNDAFAPPAGVQHLLSRLPNAESVFLENYAHFDILWSSTRTQDIFLPVLQFLERHQ